MFLYPEQTNVGRVLPKNKVYGHAKPSRTVRQRFVDEVEEIVWRHKLAPETQFNRKVEINRELRECQAALAELTR